MNDNEKNTHVQPEHQDDRIKLVDIMELVHAVLRKWKYIVLSMLICGIAAGAYCAYGISPSYRADASLSVTPSNTLISIEALQTGTALKKDYEMIIKSRRILLKVIDNLDMKISYGALYGMIAINNVEDTHIITITVTAGSPDAAVAIANEVLLVGNKEIPKLLGHSENTILDMAAKEYTYSTKPSTSRYATLGMMVGAVLACGVLLVIKLFDSTLKNADEIARIGRLPVLGIIPYFDGGKKDGEGQSWPMELSFATSEALNQLSINMAYSGKNIKTIAVTSSHANEGKSFVSFELANSLAKINKKALLIDADMRKSVLRERLDAKANAAGLSEYLAGNASIKDIISHSSTQGLDIIFSGKHVPTVTSLLSSDLFDELCRAVSEEYDYIIIDTPPLGIVGDAAIVATKVDGTLIVVESGHTDREEFAYVRRELDSVNANGIGVVVNMVGNERDSYYSYYGRYYGKKGYGRYSRYGKYGKYYKSYGYDNTQQDQNK